jgi:hypothetical protein
MRPGTTAERSMELGVGAQQMPTLTLRPDTNASAAVGSPSLSEGGCPFNRGCTSRVTSSSLNRRSWVLQLPHSRPTQAPSGQRPSHTIEPPPSGRWRGCAVAPAAPPPSKKGPRRPQSRRPTLNEPSRRAEPSLSAQQQRHSGIVSDATLRYPPLAQSPKRPCTMRALHG